ncbi:hypothetical protein [Hymenobacter rigui]|uniref:VCBS repeat-containing protein n=1 Tax=Hymenobacter rigui TaxID=334424 RepID=A0A428KSR5_9BACT|nr:hypothetical protein [Hymenobacter rigui]RSK49547.1 hypothetical protein EI291_08640 [Hymenobacter rigui]
MQAVFIALLLASFVTTIQPGPTPKIPVQGHTLSAFIPARYDTLSGGCAIGDLNQDGRPDVALVLYPKSESRPDYDDETMPGRVLIVLFSTAQGYKLAAQANRAMIARNGGGQYGDPFAGLNIRRGVLTVNHYGGSSWRWSVISKFRYQQGNFFLIGESLSLTRATGDCESLDGSPGGDY